MTNGVLSDDIIINGVEYPDLRVWHTSDINQQLDAHSTSVARTTFYAQWALHNAGFWPGKIDGIVGPTNALYNAFVAAYNQNYDSPDIPRPSGGHLSFKFFQLFMQDNSSVDIDVYKVVD